MEELKLILDMVVALSGQGKEAFILWLIFSKGFNTLLIGAVIYTIYKGFCVLGKNLYASDALDNLCRSIDKYPDHYTSDQTKVSWLIKWINDRK